MQYEISSQTILHSIEIHPSDFITPSPPPVRVSPYFIHNVSLQEIRDQQESFIAETRAKEGKSQLRTVRSIAIREIERFKSEWRDNKEVIVNGVLKKLQFKKWLQHTGKDKDYLSMDT
jgi:hypothetical protein